MSSTCAFIVLVICCAGSVYSKSIPSYITLCHRNDPKLEECVAHAVEQIRPHLKDGIPDLLLPPMNPLVLPEASLNGGENFKASFKNIQLYYVDEFKIEDLKIDLEKIHIDLVLKFPKLRIRSEYNMDGKILILQLQGQGPADGNFTDVTAKTSVDGSLYQKKGKQFISVNATKLDLVLGKPVFRFDDIFRDNKELNDQTNKVLNDNIGDILDELRPVIYEVVTEFAIGVISRVFNRYSFDELFPK